MDDNEDVPQLLPARMLNEFVYCPRLFYMEWVDDRWADNADTAQGDLAHRRVDVESGSLPDPSDTQFISQARSVRLSSDKLGLVAIVDRVDTGDGSCVPLDVKKGAARPDGTAWPADRVQVIVHALLLREHGYRVTEAAIFYLAQRRRVRVSITDEAVSEVQGIVESARRVAAAGEAPPPLVESPKCPRCSLVGLCLPDETNALLGRSQVRPRRIVPRDPDHRPLYVTEQGAVVGIRGGRVRVTKDGSLLHDARIIDVAQLSLFGNVQASSQALAQLWSHGVPVLWLSYGGWLRGWAPGEPSKYVQLRRRQYAVAAQGGQTISREFISGKIRNCRTLLRRNARSEATAAVGELNRLCERIRRVRRHDELLGVEGTAARTYFDAFTAMIAPERRHLVAGFDQAGRARRPPPDELNCLLSYCYTLLVKDMVVTCLGVGLDPGIGFLHRPRFGRPALAIDLVEEFRPLVADSTVLNLINNGEIAENHFIRRNLGVTLTADGRRKVIRAYERRLDQEISHPVFRYRISYRRVFDVQARLLASVILGELPRYIPMTTR